MNVKTIEHKISKEGGVLETERRGVEMEAEEQEGREEKHRSAVRRADRLYPSIQMIEGERQQEPSAV